MSTSTSDRGRVLIVDDDQRVLELLVDLLELEGYEVAAAADGAEGTDLAHSFGPDVVISDVVMPRVSGLELCRRLKQDPQTASIPVLLISGIRKADEAGIEGLHAGADDYVDLPFRNEELLVKVARLVERHRAAAALKESEERYRRLVELSPDAIVILRDGCFSYVNPAAQRLWGASNPEELIGRSILSVVHSDYHDHFNEQVDYIQQFQQPTPLAERKCIRLDGAEIHVEVTGLPFSAEGKSGVLYVFRDVTEKKQARESIRDREERYHELFENANDIIYTHDLQGNFTSLNRSGERITGYTREETMKMNVADVIAPEYLNLAREMIRQKSSQKVSTVYEIDIISKQGRRIRLEVSTRVIFRDGRPVGVQGIARDLTERKHSEAALRESQAFFNSFMDNSPAVAFMKDDEGRYVYVNKPFEKVFGQKLSFLKGRTSFDWLPPISAADTHDDDLKVLEGGRPQECIESLPVGDGTMRHWLVFKFPTIDSAGRRYISGVGVDITERCRAEEALAQQAEREAMSHRISQAIRCSLDSHEIYRTAVRELGSHLEVDRCSLYMRNDRARCATNVAEYHVEDVQPAASDFPLAHLQTLITALDNTGVLVFNDAAHDKRITDFYNNILSKANVKSIMYVAIRVGDDVPAAFALSTTKHIRRWSEADLDLAKAIADQTGIAIRQAELYQKAESTSTREALVNRLTMLIRASLSLPEVLSTATRELGRALSASRVHLFLSNSEEFGSPLEQEYLAPGVASIKQFQINYDDPIGRRLSTSSRPLIIEDALKYDDTSTALSNYVRSQAEKLVVRSQINYPIIINDQFRGVLCIHQSDRVRRWNEDELSLVEAIAERLVIAIAQAELFEMVARGKTEWETTFDAMSDGIFIFDRAGELKRVNRAGAAMEALHPRLLLGRQCCAILRTSEEDETCVVENALETRRSITIEITPNRLSRPLLVSVEPVLDENNNAVGVVCTARDLSDLRKVQAVAREHQSLLNNILESARESIYAVDTEGNFKWCNSATLKGLGFQRSAFIGRSLLDMVYEGDRDHVKEKLNAALNGLPQTYEMRYFAHDGRLRYARVDNSPLVVDGRTTGVLGIARDITEQKEERERAARADKLRALGQLASGVAHDFNNSLAAILGRAQLLRRQIDEPALVRNLDIIQTAAEDAAATVRRIQTFARKSPVKEFELVDVASLINDAIEITRTRWQNEARIRGLEYDVKLEAETGHSTYGSASELREVFVNLIVNAVDAMPKGGKLSATCRRVDSRLKLTFSDNGMGMPDDVRQKIFEPFFSTKGAHGTGLGLSVSYSIIERHAGTISVVSEPGQGTIFMIDLPAAVAESTSDEVETINTEMASLRILVVDDELPVRETLAEMLVAVRHRVELAGSGQEALQKMRQHTFDFVFTDLAMPEMDGWETARSIRKGWPDVKIVLVTGYGPNTTPPPGEEQLVDAIIGKPFDFSQVGSTLNALAKTALLV